MESGVMERMVRARDAFADGKPGAAVGLLGDVVAGTNDPELLAEVRGLGQEGLAQAGRFSKRPWQSLLAEVDKQLAKLDGEARA